MPGGQPMTMKQNPHSVRQPQVQTPQQTGMNGIGISEVAALTPTGGGGNGTGNAASGGTGSGGTPGGGPNAVPNNSFSTGKY